MQRGEIWWAELPPPVGRRPVILISRDRAIQVRSNITIAPVTTTIRGIDSEVPLSIADGLPKSCVVNCDSLQTIPKNTLRERVALLSDAKRQALNNALRYAIGLD